MEPSKEQLSAYLDNALSPADRAMVERALEQFPALRKEMDLLRRTRDLIKGQPTPTVPLGFEERVLRAAQRSPDRPRWLWRAPALIGAAVAVLVMLRPDPSRGPSLDHSRSRDNSWAIGRIPPMGSRMEASVVEPASRSMPPHSSGEMSFDRRDDALLESASAGADHLSMQTGTPLKDSSSSSSLAAAAPAEKKRRALVLAPSMRAASVKNDKVLSLPRSSKSAGDAWNGFDSRVSSLQTVVVRSPAEWNAAWILMDRAGQAPAIDFSKQAVVGVFLGSRPSGGYGVSLSIEETPQETIVHYTETRPPADAITLSVMTQPHAFRSIPNTGRPVRFVKKISSRGGNFSTPPVSKGHDTKTLDASR